MKKRRSLFFPMIVLDPASPEPLHAQIRTQIAAAIRRNASAGERLPSSRILASFLGVSRNTVLTAYENLAADGLIQGQHGSGMSIAAERKSGLSFDLTALLYEAQYPARTLDLADSDGNPLRLVY